VVSLPGTDLQVMLAVRFILRVYEGS
jgi:hypothetical protein